MKFSKVCLSENLFLTILNLNPSITEAKALYQQFSGLYKKYSLTVTRYTYSRRIRYNFELLLSRERPRKLVEKSDLKRFPFIKHVYVFHG